MKRTAIGMVAFWCFMAVSGAAWCGDNMNGTVTLSGLAEESQLLGKNELG